MCSANLGWATNAPSPGPLREKLDFFFWYDCTSAFPGVFSEVNIEDRPSDTSAKLVISPPRLPLLRLRLRKAGDALREDKEGNLESALGCFSDTISGLRFTLADL
jgi:hypothetical protein